MHTMLVVTHVSAMILSLGMMAGALTLGIFGKQVAARLATVGFYATTVGFASGGILLFHSPLSLECAILTGYLIGITLLYHFGFAFGDAKNARLIRQLQ